MSTHFNTGPGLPQTRAEVDALTDEGLDDFMAFCQEEPADFDGCLACYAYSVAQDRDSLWRRVPPVVVQPLPTIPLADLWAALDRNPEDLAGYVADHGAEAVTAELLRSVRALWDRDQAARGTESVDLSADEQQIIAHALNVALAGEWNDGDFTFEDEDEAERMLTATRSALTKLED